MCVSALADLSAETQEFVDEYTYKCASVCACLRLRDEMKMCGEQKGPLQLMIGRIRKQISKHTARGDSEEK